MFLNPGDFYFSTAQVLIRTLLGSCVSITLWHRRLHMGGMCHYVIPSRLHRAGDTHLDGRYADEAVTMFLRAVERCGTRPHEYQVGMFGGGRQFPGVPESRVLDIPAENVTVGRNLLERHGFVVSAMHVGGHGFRRVNLDLSTGYVTVMHPERRVLGCAP